MGIPSILHHVSLVLLPALLLPRAAIAAAISLKSFVPASVAQIHGDPPLGNLPPEFNALSLKISSCLSSGLIKYQIEL